MIRLEAIEKVYRTDRIEALALNSINLQVDAGESSTPRSTGGL